MDINTNIEKIRAEFPVLKYKRYLNSAAHGPTLKRAHDATQEWWNHRINEEDVPAPDVLGEAAKMLRCDTDELCQVNRVSQGLNIIAKMMKPVKGDNIVVTDLGYQSNVYVWFPYMKEGVEIRRIPHRDGVIETSDFEAAIDDKTKAVSMSHVEWTSGVKYDMKAISDIAHEHGVYVIDDAYQAMGAVTIDVHGDDVDFFTSGSEKWLCCPAMNGVLYVKKSIQDEFEPTYMNYHNVEEAFRDGAPWEKPDHDNIASYNKPLYRDARKYDRSCVCEEFTWGFHATLEYFNSLGAENIQKKIASLSQYLIEGLKEHPVKINTPEDPKNRAGLVTYNTGSFDKNQAIYDALKKEDIIVAHRYAAGIGGIRVSCHFFNTEQDIDRVLSVQKKVLA
ncbi:MAG: aminotransferase class V-fold PLP-dependent enzyme [Candidatus Bathyarchaeota archaeon]|nr:aminotransferase class V-fold PLP-dependent enzyme [Candidatus Bathyarchaeota archaeon]